MTRAKRAVRYESIVIAVGTLIAAFSTSLYPAAGANARAPSLSSSFHQVALQGFGDYQNSWPWAAAWYNGRVYIGTDRNMYCVSAFGTTPYPPSDPDLHCPGNPPQVQDLPPASAAQIWSVDPSSAQVLTQSNWIENYASPLTVPLTIAGTLVMGPRDIGYRGMSVFTESDGTQSLYVSGVGTKGFGSPGSPPPSLLRSPDGVTFQPVPSDPGTTLGDINALTTTATSACCMRGQASFRGYFYVTVTNAAGSGSLFASASPQLGNNTFKQITPQGLVVYEIQPFNGHLYIGTASAKGYGVWRTDCTAPPPGQLTCPWSAFTPVIPPGAGLTQGTNVSVTSMQVFTDTAGIPHLYIGAASSVAHGPAPAELARVNQDDSWDLVVGTSRTVNGILKAPLSGLGEGFGWPFNLHMWRMAVYNNVLFVGTYDSSTSTFKGTSLSTQFQPYMGFDLFASPDGVNFIPITLNGFGDMFSEGIRALVSTPYGLFVGAANHWYGLRIWQGLIPFRTLQLAPHTLQADTVPGGRIALSWAAPPHAARFFVYRAEVREKSLSLPRTVTGGEPTNRVRRAKTWWLPDQYHMIATTSVPFFVDDLAAGRHAAYYVVSQDALGRISAPSNTANVPALLAPPTFGGAIGVLQEMAARGFISPEQASMLHRRLENAETDLRAGNLDRSRADLAAANAHMSATLHTAAGRRYAEELSFVLDRLATREIAVARHVLPLARLATREIVSNATKTSSLRAPLTP